MLFSRLFGTLSGAHSAVNQDWNKPGQALGNTLLDVFGSGALAYAGGKAFEKLDDLIKAYADDWHSSEPTKPAGSLKWPETEEELFANGGKNGYSVGTGDYSSLVDKAGNIDVSTSAHQAVFYSGEGNRVKAEAFAQLNGKTTLEMTPGGKYFDDLKLFEASSPLTKTQVRDIWKILSERYAKGASGNVYGFVNGANPGSIFNTVEYPALQIKPNITNVFTEFLK